MLLSCTDRERINPLDPKNADTLGRPTGFKVFSIQDTVYLGWTSIDLKDLNGFQIYRTTNGLDEFLPVQLVPPSNNSFKDTNIEFEIEYTYFMTAVGANYESPPSDTLGVIPGPTLNWVASNTNQQLLKLTHDLRHRILTVSGFLPIFDIEANPRTGEVWVIERLLNIFGNAIRISANGEILRPFAEFTEPLEAALDYGSGSLWVADAKAGQVVKLDSVGNETFSISGISRPVSVSIDQRNGYCWVADGDLNQISRISADGSGMDVSPVALTSVKSVVVNSKDGSVWVADSTRVLRVNESGQLELELVEEFGYVKKIAVNDLTGDVWIIDQARSTVSKFSANGEAVFEVDGFSAPGDLSVNLFDHSCLVADTENDRLVQITTAGVVSRIFTQVGLPDAVHVQNPFVN